MPRYLSGWRLVTRCENSLQHGDDVFQPGYGWVPATYLLPARDIPAGWTVYDPDRKERRRRRAQVVWAVFVVLLEV
jgi:hypothetical protein